MKLSEIKDVPEYDVFKNSSDSKRNVYVAARHLTSLKGAPEIVNGEFDCSNNWLRDLQYSPKIIHGDYNCCGNEINSLHNVHKHIKRIDGIFSFGDQKCHPNYFNEYGAKHFVMPHLLGLCFIEGITEIYCYYPVNDIFKQTYPDVHLFQEGLLEAGFTEQAKF